MTFRHLKIFMWSVGTTVIVTVVVVLTTLGWAITYPQQAWNFASRHFMPQDLTVKWEKIDFQAKKQSWKRWDIVWSTENLSIDKGSPKLHLPVAKASLQLTIRIFEDGPWLHFDEVVVLGNETVTFQPSEEPKEKSSESPYQQLYGYLEYLERASRWSTAKKLTLDFPAIQILGAEAPMELAINVVKPAAEGSTKTAFNFSTSKKDFKLLLAGRIDASQLDSNEPFLNTDVQLQLPTSKADISLTGIFDGKSARFDGKSTVEIKNGGKVIKASPRFRIHLNESEALITGASKVPDILGSWVSMDQLDLEVRLPMDDGYAWSERPAKFKLSSKLALFFIDKDMRPPLEKSCRCKIPEKLLLEVDGRFYPEFLLNESSERKPIADTNLKIEGIDNQLFYVNLAAHVKVDRKGQEWIVEPRLDSAVEVRSFQGLRQFLDAKNIMVPSPLDVLDGTIKFSARATVSRDNKTMRTPIEIDFDLKSATQRVLLGLTVNLDLANNFKSLDVLLDALIRDVTLELPPLDPVLGIPAMARDSRVEMLPVKKAKADPNAFQLRVFYKVKTDGAGKVRLLSKLAIPNVPLTLDLNNNAQGESTGFLRAEPFTINYLRRKLNIERMQVTLSEDDKGDYPVGGRVRIDQTSYKIFVEIGGTTSSPSVQLTSEPFLPRNEIISVLLYNRTSDSLVSADSETVGSFEAALTDRAIGLFGLWAFASTPIRSFSYNSVTKVYTATVDLGDGVSAGIGTNWERAASLEVRKRVSRRWVLTASWSPGQQNEQVGKLVLQWEKRF